MNESEPKQRIVAIVGRPNVGKSAIFNRLVGRRVAIVHEQSGVTRDRLMHEAEWRNQKYTLVDTGGIANLDHSGISDSIDAGTRSQADVALQDAAVVIFVVDISAGIVPLDQEVANILRKSGNKVFVAANKSDEKGRDELAAEFDQFGFKVFPVSALHDRGFEQLMLSVMRFLPKAENLTIKEPLKVAIVGRPNVGKSSFINRMLEKDRVIVSSVPGTTRDSIDVPFTIGTGEYARHYLLIDTAGMRRQGKIDNLVEKYALMRSEKSVERCNVAVLILDAVQGPTEHDKKIAAYINEQKRGCVILVNKWDLAKGVTKDEYDEAVRKVVPFMRHCPIVFVSALSGDSIRKSLSIIDIVAGNVRTKLPTGVLNRVIIDAAERVHPPAVGGKRLKIFYTTQTGIDPIRVSIFVNEISVFVKPYRDYIIRTLRERFPLDGAPIDLIIRSRRKDDAK